MHPMSGGIKWETLRGLLCSGRQTMRSPLVCIWILKRSMETWMISLHRNEGHKLNWSCAEVLHDVTMLQWFGVCKKRLRLTQEWAWVQFFHGGFKKWLQQIIECHIQAQPYQKCTGHAYEQAPQCAWTYSWAEYRDEVHLCGLPAERPRWVIPAAVLSHSKRMAMDWLSKPLSCICLIWAFCLHLSSAPRMKAVALPLL